MKKLLFVAIIAMVALFSCRKAETPIIASEMEKVPVQELSQIREKLGSNPNLVVITEEVGANKCAPVTECSPIPIGVGAAIGYSQKAGFIDVTIFAQFYWNGYIRPGKMSLTLSYEKNGSQKILKPIWFEIKSTANVADLIILQKQGINVPIGVPVTFLVNGYNNCGGVSSYSFNYTYTNTAARPSTGTSNVQLMDWLQKTTTIGVEVLQ